MAHQGASLPSAILTGLKARCPRCGQGPLFRSGLVLRAKCDRCGLYYAFADSGDGPAVFVILIVGAIVAPLLLVLQFGLDLPDWVALAITMVAAVVLCLALLPPFKAILFALQWKHKASEATRHDVDQG